MTIENAVYVLHIVVPFFHLYECHHCAYCMNSTRSASSTFIYSAYILRLKLAAKNLVKTPISQTKPKTPLFYMINQPNGPKLASQAIKKVSNPVYFSKYQHGPYGHGQPESARFRSNGPFRFWSSIFDPN